MKLITTVITALAIFFVLIAWKPVDLILEPSAKRTSSESLISAIDNLSVADFCYDNGDGIYISFEKSGTLIITADDAVRDDEIEIGIENNQLYIASSIAGAKNQKNKKTNPSST